MRVLVQRDAHAARLFRQRLKHHLPEYDKGQRGYWAATQDRLEQAVARAETRAAVTTAYDGNEPYTCVHKLILLLAHLKD